MEYHIFSDPLVLESMRNELSMGIRQDHDDTCIIDRTHVKSSCPILLSTFMEIMCVYSVSTAIRIAMEDYRFNYQYLFNKGSIIMMPSVAQHTIRSVWGDTINEFNHARYTPGNKRGRPFAFRTGAARGTYVVRRRHKYHLVEGRRCALGGILHPSRYSSQFYWFFGLTFILWTTSGFCLSRRPW